MSGIYVNIEHGASFKRGFEIELGDYSGIGIDCHIPDDIIIGKDVLMGPKCYILDKNHIVDRIDIPMRGRGYVKKQTIIEDDVWIGSGCKILDGVHIKKGAIIAC